MAGGYLDVGGLIPETVQRIEYRKGPYRAEDGDFAFVGSARISTVDPVWGVEGYDSKIAEPRQIRIGIKATFR